MNIIDAIYNLISDFHCGVDNASIENNRANSVGASLEEYVKDLFAETVDLDKRERDVKLAEVFSYLGNSKNPPDMMLRGGDAIEVKKVETLGTIQLNSSFPKKSLKRTSSFICQSCRDAEEWDEKDILYIIGQVRNKQLKSLFMVYGSEYCAQEDTYTNTLNAISEKIKEIDDLHLQETREIAHVADVDAVGSYLRVRPMWVINNPKVAFHYLYEMDTTKEFNFMALMNQKNGSLLKTGRS